VNRRDVLACVAGLTAGGTALKMAAGKAAQAAELPKTDNPDVTLSEICQVAIVVKDIEREAKRCARLLGMEVPQIVLTDTEEKAHTRFRGAPTSAQAKLAFFRFGSMVLELIEPVGGPSTWKEFLDEHGEGVHHIAFHIKGMDRVLKVLEGKGFPTIQTGDFEGGRYAYVDTTPVLKTIVELLEIESS